MVLGEEKQQNKKYLLNEKTVKNQKVNQLEFVRQL